jgi:tetratricopeptide (TPR) repeat protein
MSPLKKVATLIAALTLMAPITAWAQNSSRESDLEEARQHVNKAKVHYDLGEYEQAAEEYTIVYRIRPLPALLFNIAQAYRQAGLYEKARQFYRSYLRESPDKKRRPTIEQAIKELDELLAKERRTKELAPNGVTQEPAAETALARPSQQPAPAQAGARAPKQAEATAAKPAAAEPATVAAKPAAAQPVKAAPPAAAKTPGVQVAMSAPRAAVAATNATPVVEESTPIYKKWWFWTAAGVVVVGGGAAIAASRAGGPPSTHFGNTPVF